MNTRKPIALLIALMMALTALCVPAAAESSTELIVFAAASMTETLTELKTAYEAANPGVSWRASSPLRSSRSCPTTAACAT